MTSPFSAGQKVRASSWNLFTVGASSTGDLTVSGGAIQDVPSATVTFTLNHSSVAVTVVASFDIECATYGGLQAAIGYLYVDGSQQAAQAIHQASAVGQRATVSQNWPLTLGSGSHTLKLRAGGGGAATHSTVHQQHTSFTVTCLDIG